MNAKTLKAVAVMLSIAIIIGGFAAGGAFGGLGEAIRRGIASARAPTPAPASTPPAPAPAPPPAAPANAPTTATTASSQQAPTLAPPTSTATKDEDPPELDFPPRSVPGNVKNSILQRGSSTEKTYIGCSSDGVHILRWIEGSGNPYLFAGKYKVAGVYGSTPNQLHSITYDFTGSYISSGAQIKIQLVNEHGGPGLDSAGTISGSRLTQSGLPGLDARPILSGIDLYSGAPSDFNAAIVAYQNSIRALQRQQARGNEESTSTSLKEDLKKAFGENTTKESRETTLSGGDRISC